MRAKILMLLDVEKGFGIFCGNFGNFFERELVFFGEKFGDVGDEGGFVDGAAVRLGGEKGGVGFEEGVLKGR